MTTGLWALAVIGAAFLAFLAFAGVLEWWARRNGWD